MMMCNDKSRCTFTLSNQQSWQVTTWVVSTNCYFNDMSTQQQWSLSLVVKSTILKSSELGRKGTTLSFQQKCMFSHYIFKRSKRDIKYLDASFWEDIRSGIHFLRFSFFSVQWFSGSVPTLNKERRKMKLGSPTSLLTWDQQTSLKVEQPYH